jgi:hypothetical protein
VSSLVNSSWAIRMMTENDRCESSEGPCTLNRS